MNRPLIIAHRGDSAHAPENTLAAFAMAIEKGAEGIEFDVQLSRDGVPVVIHDHNMIRTGNFNERVANLTATQLGEIDVGSWFNRKAPDRARPEFSYEFVPTLRQALELLENFDGPIYIELKIENSETSELAAAVSDVIGGTQLFSQIIVKSFRLGAIPIVRGYLPEVQTGALFAPEIMNYLRRREHMIVLAKEFGAQRLSVHHSLLTPKLSRLAADAEMPLIVWTVDEPGWLMRRDHLQIHSLISNDPHAFLDVANP